MAFLVKGSAGSTSSNPVLDLYTFVSGILTDCYSCRIQVFDYSTEEKRAKYHSGSKGDVQVFPVSPGTFYTLDVVHLASDPMQPGHKLSVGHYYAPWTPGDDSPLGDYIVEWTYQETDLTPYKKYCEEFVLVQEGELLTGLSCLEKLKLYMQDFISKNELIDEVEYTDQQYILAMEMATSQFNLTPAMTSFSMEIMCKHYMYPFIIGSAGHLLQSTSIEQLRNQLTYTDGNVHVGLKDKHQLYLNAAQVKLQEFSQLVRQIKNQLNNDNGWGQSDSPYSYTGMSAYGTGWGWGSA